MRKLFLILAIVAGAVASAYAQKKSKNSEWQVDKFRATYSSGMSIIPIATSFITDIGPGGTSYIGSGEVTTEPDYAFRDTTSYLFSTTAHVGLNIPFISTRNWSIGANLNAGIGLHYNLRAAEGVKGFVFDLPQYVYYRNYGSKLDYSILGGYKYTKAPLPYHLALAGVEVRINEDLAIRLNGSVNSYNYYNLFTDGRLDPALQYREFGVTFTRNF